jgi:hypothetical protein
MIRKCGLAFALAVLLPIATSCRSSAISIGDVGISPWDDGRTVGAQLQLKNSSNATLHNVRVTEIEVEGGRRSGPVPLPITIGDLAPGKDALLDALLQLTGIDGRARSLRVEGDFQRGTTRRHFHAAQTIRPDSRPAPPIQTFHGTATKQTPATATYPTPPPQPPRAPNAETPMFIPIGPPRVVFPPTPTGTALGAAPAAAGVQIPVNSTMNNIGGVPPDPNAAAASPTGVSLVSWNTAVSYSTNGGGVFNDIPLFSPQPGNPSRTSFFPQSDGGLCCDQVVVYIPSQNIFVWLMQHRPVFNGTNITQTSRLRVAWATPEAAAADFWNAWTYIDLTAANTPGVSSGLGVATNEHLDYPDLAWSDTFLYVGIDHGWPDDPGSVYPGRRIVARLSLADMVDTTVAVVNYGFAELTGSSGLNKSHFVQGAPSQMVVGSLDDTSTIRVFTWADASSSIDNTTAGISQIQGGAAYTSLAPDNNDWYGVSFPGNITGGAYRHRRERDEYLFAFDAGVNAPSRPRAYLRLETLTPNGSGYSVAEEYDVWNADYAFGLGGLGSDGQEIGLTLAVGGGTIGYPQFAVGYKDDFVVFTVTNSTGVQSGRFGDYVPNRLVPSAGLFFGTGVYEVTLNPLPPGTTTGICATVGCTVRMRYVQYGRTPPG